MFEKTLSDLVRGIRAHRGSEVMPSSVNVWINMLTDVHRQSGSGSATVILLLLPLTVHRASVFGFLNRGLHACGSLALFCFIYKNSFSFLNDYNLIPFFLSSGPVHFSVNV